MRLLHALHDVRPVPRRAATLRAAWTACPALLTVALLAWALGAQCRVFAPLLTHLRAAGSPAPYAATPRTATAALVLLTLTAGVLASVHLARTLIADNAPTAAPAASGQMPVCARCHGPKPPRCHHCRMCNRCCLKMDHHCLLSFLSSLFLTSDCPCSPDCALRLLLAFPGPWVGCCIGFYNYKFFLAFLGWTHLLCVLIVVETVPLVPALLAGRIPLVCRLPSHVFPHASQTSPHTGPQDDTGAVLHMLILAICAVAFGIAVAILLGVHIVLLRANTTTLESSGLFVCTPSPPTTSTTH